MEKNSNLTILVGLIFIFLLVTFLYQFLFSTYFASFGSAIIYKQDTSCKETNNEIEGASSKDVKVYTNGSRRSQDVTGDLIVKKNTCTVRVTYGPGPNDFYEITPGNKDAQDSRTITVARDQEMKIHCRVTERKDKCKWKYSRSSP